MGGREVAAIDPEEFYDFQVNRPTITLVDGDTRRIEWPTTHFSVASPPDAERDVRPHPRASSPACAGARSATRSWRSATASKSNASSLLGALLADVPYNRPLPISGNAGARDREKLDLTPRGTRARPGSSASSTTPPARRTRLPVVLGARAALREQPAVPQGDARAAASCRGRPRPPDTVADLAEESASWERKLRSPPSRTPSSRTTYANSRSARARRHAAASGDEIAQEFEKYLRRRGGPTAK